QRTCIRLDTEKFSFDILGDEKDYTEAANFRKVSDLFRAQAPKAIFDEGFERFRPPADVLTRHSREVGSSVKTRSDTKPAFDFYSPWRVILYAKSMRR